MKTYTNQREEPVVDTSSTCVDMEVCTWKCVANKGAEAILQTVCIHSSDNLGLL